MTVQQSSMGLQNTERIDSVDTYTFEPIKGYPMLNWYGKRPFRSTSYYPAQLKEIHGDATDGWRSKIFWGDNLQVMSHLLKEFRGQVQLVYIDPPFDSKADYKRQIRHNGKAITNEHSTFEEKQYSDIWVNDEYLQYMYERFILIRELMSSSGSIYLHCDYRRSHMLKIIMDEVFGPDNFQNEIIWVRTNAHNLRAKGYVRANDHILYFTKTGTYTFNELYTPYGEAQRSRYREDENGRLYTGRDLTFSGVNPARQFEWRGTKPPANRSWGSSLEQLEGLWEEGRILVKQDGTPRLDGYKVYLKETKGNPLTTNWDEISRVGNTSSERLDYPTQKPESLIERIINVSSNPDDIILDCFMGSGTTQAVAMKLGRRFIGADINLGAVQITTKRLIQVAKEVTDNPPKQAELPLTEDDEEEGDISAEPTVFYTGFEVYNVNNYDIFRNPVEAKALLLEALEVQKLPAGHLFDGERDGRLWKIMPVNRIATRADLNELLAGFDYRAFEKRRADNANRPVEKLTLVCMGHEPDLAAQLMREAHPYLLDVEVVDILRDKQNLQFKRDAEAKVVIRNGQLIVEAFYPMNLLQKLSLQKETVDEWRELVESIMIDWNYDGAILTPTVVDVPDKNELVSGRYPVPADAGTIRVKITDLLSESWEGEAVYA
jgi:adenine-specific DNA-methyltransferase